MEFLPPISDDVPALPHERNRFCASQPNLDLFLDLHKVKRVSNKSKSGIYQDIRAGTFPAPVPIAKGRVAWLASEIAEWQRRCIEARRKAAAACRQQGRRT